MDHAYLEFSRDSRRQMAALDADRLIVGRADGNDLCFPAEDTVSGRHAALERRPEGWVIRDLGSTNGTYVNGTKIVTERMLQPGDEVILGRLRMVFRVRDPEASTDSNSAMTQAITPEWPTPSAEQAQAPPGTAAKYLDIGEEWGSDPAQLDSTSPSVARRPREAARPRASLPQPPPPAPVAARPARIAGSAPPARPSRGSGHVRGVARGIEIRSTGMLAFRVDRYDGSGNRLEPVAVEFRHHQGGQVSEGEEVEVTGKWSHGTLRARKILNLSTHAEVRGLSKGTKVLVGCFLSLWVAGAIFILFAFVFL